MYTRRYKSDPAVLLAELDNLLLGPDDPKFAQRVELVSIVLRGEKSPAQVAEMAGFSKRAVQGWVSTVDESGWDGLRSGQAGRRNRLSAEQIEEVKLVVLDAKEKGGKVWTAQTLATHIRETYHIEYGASAATKLMARLGLERRRGRPPGRSKRSAPASREVAQTCPSATAARARKTQQTGAGHRKPYTSDITRAQYELVRPLLESVTVEEIDLYDHFCGVLYILTTAAQWANLPGDFPNYKSVYHYWHLWTLDREGGSIITKCLNLLRGTFRNNMGKNDKLTLGIVDAKSIKNVDTAREKGYDAGKKVSGIKLHALVDTLGLPHALLVTCADTTDRDGAIEMVSLNLDALSEMKRALVDGGYSGKPFADKMRSLLPNVEVEVVKRNELHTFSVLPKRWIVERSFGWLEKHRRLWKNCEKSLEMSLQMTVLAFVSILLRRF